MGTHAAVESIQLENLTKSFGKLSAVKDLSFSVAPGEVLGFLGPNGAGKTTVMRILVGLLAPSSGSATVLGFDVKRRDTKMLSRVGYLPGTLALYENLTGLEFLNFISRMRRLDTRKNIDLLAQRLQLDLHRHIHDLSKGNRQKVGVISAFMHEPDVLILDEPTGGLDPLMQREFELMLTEAKSRGTAILLSSHVMSEAENLGSRIAIINEGKLLMLEDISTLKLKTLKKVEFTFSTPIDPTQFASMPGVRSVKATAKRLLFEVVGTETELLQRVSALGAISVETQEPSLDEIFLRLIENGARQ